MAAAQVCGKKPHVHITKDEGKIGCRVGRHSGFSALDINKDGQLDVFTFGEHRRLFIYVPKMIEGMGQFLSQYEEHADGRSITLASYKPAWASNLQRNYNTGAAMLAGAKEVFIKDIRATRFYVPVVMSVAEVSEKGRPISVGSERCHYAASYSNVVISCLPYFATTPFTDFAADVQGVLTQSLARAK